MSGLRGSRLRGRSGVAQGSIGQGSIGQGSVKRRSEGSIGQGSVKHRSEGSIGQGSVKRRSEGSIGQGSVKRVERQKDGRDDRHNPLGEEAGEECSLARDAILQEAQSVLQETQSCKRCSLSCKGSNLAAEGSAGLRVRSLASPRNVAPPHGVPPTRRNEGDCPPSARDWRPSTRSTDTPEPMLISSSGKSSSGHATGVGVPA